MTDLIKQAEQCLSRPCELHSEHETALYVLRDCVTEVQRLTTTNETLKALNAEYAERIKALKAKGEPVAVRYDCDGYGYLYIDNGSDSDWQRRHKDAEPLYTTPPNIKELIADAIEKHDDEMAIAKTVNMRTQAQPYLDELIAEIDALPVHRYFAYEVDHDAIKAITDKYRSAK